MRISNALNRRKMLRGGFVLLQFSILAGCTTDTNPVRDAVASAGFGPKIAPAPDFVARSRPARLDFIPVGTGASGRPTPARTADEVKAAEAEMEAVRAANDAAAQAARQGGSSAAAPAPVPVKPKPARAP